MPSSRKMSSDHAPPTYCTYCTLQASPYAERCQTALVCQLRHGSWSSVRTFCVYTRRPRCAQLAPGWWSAECVQIWITMYGTMSTLGYPVLTSLRSNVCLACIMRDLQHRQKIITSGDIDARYSTPFDAGNRQVLRQQPTARQTHRPQLLSLLCQLRRLRFGAPPCLCKWWRSSANSDPHYVFLFPAQPTLSLLPLRRALQYWSEHWTIKLQDCRWCKTRKMDGFCTRPSH
jgi:hypothetical protein